MSKASKVFDEVREALRRVADGELEHDSVAVREGPRTYFITPSERDRRQKTCTHRRTPSGTKCSWCTKLVP